MITSLFESIFNKKLSSTYDLSAFVSEDRFYFMVLSAQKELLLLRDYQTHNQVDSNSMVDTLEAIIQKDEILNLPFRKKKIALVNAKQTLIPSRLFIEDASSVYLEKIIDLLPEDVILYDNIQSIDTKVVYAFDLEIQTCLTKHFSNVQVFHGLTCYLNGILKVAEHRSGQQVYANIQDGLIFLLFVEGDELLFSNIFSFATAKDALYYVMLVFDQFSLDPNSIPLFLSGQILEESEIYKHFYRYVRKIQFLSAPDYITFGPEAQGLVKHQYFDLFSLSICE